MKRVISLLLIAAMAVSLCGCSCKHEWVDATCETPKTCSLCGQTEGEVLSHSWADADCESPKTCRLCEKTEGEALGHRWQDATCTNPKSCAFCAATEGDVTAHSYGKWEVSGESMSRSCRACGSQETIPVDRELFLRDYLKGRWDCTKVTMRSVDMDLDVTDAFKGPIPYIVIDENNTLRFFNGRDYFDGTFAFVEYKVEDGTEYYSFSGMQNGESQMSFALEITPEQEYAINAYETYYTLRYEPESQDAAMMREALTGTWVSTPKRADGSTVDYRDCTITFLDNHGFTITMNGTSYEGNWSDPDLRETEEYTIYDYYIRYNADNRRKGHFVRIIRYSAGGIQCSINFDNEFELYFQKQ